jgi:hypothetical protein
MAINFPKIMALTLHASDGNHVDLDDDRGGKEAVQTLRKASDSQERPHQGSKG